MTSSSEATTHSDGCNPRIRRAGAISSHHRPVPVQDGASDLRRILVVVALSVGAFGIDVTEFTAIGLLPYIAGAFGRDEDTAGRMISMYVLDVVMGAPLIAVLTDSIPHRRIPLLLMTTLTVDSSAVVQAGTPGSFEAMMILRFTAGLPHGAYSSVADSAVVPLAKPEQHGKMMALSGVGLSVATAIGVPAAQVLGQIYDWHSTLGFVAVIGPIALISLWSIVSHMNRMPKTRLTDESSVPGSAQIWLTVAVGTIGFDGMLTVYTYIAWTMTYKAGISENRIWIMLMAHGIGMVVGTYIGGWLPGRIGEQGIMVTLVLMVIILNAFYFISRGTVLGMINFLITGLLGSVLVSSLQARLVDAAGRVQTLAAALNRVALNMADASRAALDGRVIVSDYDYRAPALGGATLTMSAVLIALPTIVPHRRSQTKEAECVKLRQGSTRRSVHIGNIRGHEPYNRDNQCQRHPRGR